jgi:hypothetical protein
LAKGCLGPGVLLKEKLIHYDDALPADLDQHTGGLADLHFTW